MWEYISTNVLYRNIVRVKIQTLENNDAAQCKKKKNDRQQNSTACAFNAIIFCQLI